MRKYHHTIFRGMYTCLLMSGMTSIFSSEISRETMLSGMRSTLLAIGDIQWMECTVEMTRFVHERIDDQPIDLGKAKCLNKSTQKIISDGKRYRIEETVFNDEGRPISKSARLDDGKKFFYFKLPQKVMQVETTSEDSPHQSTQALYFLSAWMFVADARCPSQILMGSFKDKGPFVHGLEEVERQYTYSPQTHSFTEIDKDPVANYKTRKKLQGEEPDEYSVKYLEGVERIETTIVMDPLSYWPAEDKEVTFYKNGKSFYQIERRQGFKKYGNAYFPTLATFSTPDSVDKDKTNTLIVRVLSLAIGDEIDDTPFLADSFDVDSIYDLDSLKKKK